MNKYIFEISSDDKAKLAFLADEIRDIITSEKYFEEVELNFYEHEDNEIP